MKYITHLYIGEIKFPTGCRYKGYFIDNKMEGFGVFEFANKSFYYGNFINNKLVV